MALAEQNTTDINNNTNIVTLEPPNETLELDCLLADVIPFIACSLLANGCPCQQASAGHWQGASSELGS